MSQPLDDKPSPATHCFHCGEALQGRVYTALIDGVEQPMCCIGCQAAAEMIAQTGMTDFYRQRDSTEAPQRAVAVDEHYWQQFDRDEIADNFLSYSADRHIVSAQIEVRGMYCSACSWLIERSYRNLPGITALSINLPQQHIRISWEAAQLTFSEVLMVLAKLGYQLQPLSASGHSDTQQRESRQALQRIAVAGLGTMQVMGFAFGLYADSLSGQVTMDWQTEHFLNLVSLLVTTLVVFYAGAPFFRNAWRDIRNRHLGMDVPVALAIGTAYSSSVWNTLTHNGHAVYFDSAVMFIFFLSLGRFMEMRIRHQALSSHEALRQVLPPLVKLERQGEHLTLPPQQLQIGDRITLRTGDIVPCDGELERGQAELDESLLSGESRPQPRAQQAQLIGGTRLLSTEGDSITLRINTLGKDTALAHIGELLDKAQRPQQITTTDRLARYFVRGILGIAAITGLIWWFIDSERTLSIVLSVLVVTCPCALSLAAPAARTAASHFLSRRGIVLSNSHTLEVLPHIHTWCFDKTGTLSEGRMSIAEVHTLAELDAQHCLHIAAALERQVNHPVASAFQQKVEQSQLLYADRLEQHTGEGVSGLIDGQPYYLGRWDWVCEHSQCTQAEPDADGSLVALADGQRLLAWFQLCDQLRADSAALLQQLNGDNIHLISGDNASSVAQVAEQLGIAHYASRQRPEDKVAALQKLQQQQPVAMVGDGINDAPVLAQADVSITLASGSQLAHSHGDILLLNNRLSSITLARDTARRCRRITRQNLGWALLYNLSALPLAISGVLSPWMAALGMSLSSLLVVLNASRLNRGTR